jgi:hypothetical protein
MGVLITKTIEKSMRFEIDLDSIKFDFSQITAGEKNALVKIALNFNGQQKNLVDTANFLAAYNKGNATQKTVIKTFFKELIVEALNKIAAAHQAQTGKLIVFTVADILDSIFQ